MKARFLAPELATLVKEPFSDREWIFEEKFDGIRCIAVCSKGKVSLYSRNRKLLNRDFPEIVKALERKKDFVIDGEIVAFDGKVTSFTKLQNRKREKVKTYFYVFDLLVCDEEDLRGEPLIERKRLLKGHFPFKSPVRYTPHVKGRGEVFFKEAEKKGLEGVIAKRADSPYRGRRTRDWQKFKCMQSKALVIGGYTEPQGGRVGFGALLVGYYDKGKFKYAGKVGTGYDEKLLATLGKKLERIERKSTPFSVQVKEKRVHFVRPSLKCEVGFTEWTKSGKLRHPRFLRLK